MDGKTFKNYDDYPAGALGDITAAQGRRQLLQHRDDLPARQARRRRPGRAAAALGLGVDHDLGFPAYFGQVPPPAAETEKAARLIGQGKVLASPMAMATVAASVARGQAVLPRLLPAADAAADRARGAAHRRRGRRARDLMRAVVTEGARRSWPTCPAAVGAKTGTAEFGTRDGRCPTHTWMIATQGDLAVAVFVETGESGSQTAGPLLERFLRAAR